ncbi:MAG: hypothetical protein HQL37_08340 [Alphaproteobacteria bacterium]|nr:hypothetical protein [Alphaproteobacteria bacterium]
MWREIFGLVLHVYAVLFVYFVGVFGVMYVCDNLLRMPKPYGGILGLAIPTLCGLAFVAFMAWREGVNERKEEAAKQHK